MTDEALRRATELALDWLATLGPGLAHDRSRR
jgi:hypothetical protein